MKIKDVVVEDFCNYRLPSMFIVTSRCKIKCTGCQNEYLLNLKTFDVSNEVLWDIYSKSDITRAIVIGGLEPFEQTDEVLDLINYFRSHGCTDPFIIYTGYEEDEIPKTLIDTLKSYGNIFLKIGRYDSSKESYYNEQLGITLASNNQYVVLL
jgi:MoaA/NifB/PqqE/SkfB family radical SAM enzyme